MSNFDLHDFYAKYDNYIIFGLIGAIFLHIAVYLLSVFVAPYWSTANKAELEYVRVQLVGMEMPAAPAAPDAKVNPDLVSPDVVDISQHDKTQEEIVDTSSKLEPTEAKKVLESAKQTDAIAVGEKIETPLDIKKDKTPAPVVEPDKKTPEDEKPKDEIKKEEPKKEDPKKEEPKKNEPKKEPQVKTTKTTKDPVQEKIKELERKVAAEQADMELNTKIANINKKYGGGSGESSVDSFGTSDGERIEAEKAMYYAEIRRIVSENWVTPSSEVPISAQTHFQLVIQPNGSVSFSKIKKQSGYEDYDASVERAIQKSRFPALPSVFEGKPLNTVLNFDRSKM